MQRDGAVIEVSVLADQMLGARHASRCFEGVRRVANAALGTGFNLSVLGDGLAAAADAATKQLDKSLGAVKSAMEQLFELGGVE
jgi:hypothetical protein